MRTDAWRMLAFAVVYALVLVWGCEWLFSLAASREFAMGTEVGPRWTRTWLAALPFVGFALYLFVRRSPMPAHALRRAWLSGLVLSLLMWGWYFFDPAIGPQGGANIGLGILLMASPLPIFLLMWAVGRWGRAG